MTIWMMLDLKLLYSVSSIFLLVRRAGSSGVGLGCLVVQPVKKRSSVFVGLSLVTISISEFLK